MKLLTPDGLIDAEPMDYSLEEAERPVRITVADGTVLQWRPTVAVVCRYTNKDGTLSYHVTQGCSVVILNK